MTPHSPDEIVKEFLARLDSPHFTEQNPFMPGMEEKWQESGMTTEQVADYLRSALHSYALYLRERVVPEIENRTGHREDSIFMAFADGRDTCRSEVIERFDKELGV